MGSVYLLLERGEGVTKHIGLNKTARETVHGGAARHFASCIETRDLFAFPVKHFTGIVHMQTAVAVVKRDGSPRRIERPFLDLVLGLGFVKVRISTGVDVAVVP